MLFVGYASDGKSIGFGSEKSERSFPLQSPKMVPRPKNGNRDVFLPVVRRSGREA